MSNQNSSTDDLRELHLDQAIARLRHRALLLRSQSYLGVALIVLLAISLIAIFSSQPSGSKLEKLTHPAARNPYDYNLMEARHAALSDSMGELITSSTEVKQELITDKYVTNKADQKLVLSSLEEQISNLQKIKLDLDDRLSKDRQNLSLEVSRLREERDAAVRDGNERKLLLVLIGDIAFRVGALVLAMYLTSVIFTLCRYLLRVADHLNSSADSIDLLRHSSLSIESGIKALTPHAIDFHIDDSLTSKTAKDVLSIFRDVTLIDKSINK